MAGLVYVSDDEPGIERRGRARFQYVRQTTGSTVRSAPELARIRAIAVPPAWTDVWISADPRGHIQATGRDTKGRKQYRYHPDFRRRRDRHKFGELVAFGSTLGSLRARIDTDLRMHSLDRARVVAAVVQLLDLTYIRIGNEAYARDNHTFGLTTLRCRHVDIDGSHLRLRFVGKNGNQFDVTCCDARLARVVRRCQDLPGQLLFRYEDDDGLSRVTSSDVNDYVREGTGVDATAKTFRTWGASVLGAEELAALPPPESTRDAAHEINDALRPVAARLGNTVAVCRSSYVHPIVLETFERGELASAWARGPQRKGGGLDADERRLLALLQSRSR